MRCEGEGRADSQTERRDLSRAGRRLARSVAAAGVCLLLTFCIGIWLLQPSVLGSAPRTQARQPEIPADAYPYDAGLRYVNLPAGHRATLFASPVTGGVLAEWRGGTPMLALGLRFFDGYANWLLVRDPAGDEGWVGEVFLSAEPPADAVSGSGPAPTGADATGLGVVEEYVSDVAWDGPIAFCVNPAGGPPGLNDDAFVRLVERAADRWQSLAGGTLPLESRGRCDADPGARGDGSTTIGWGDDFGLIVAGLTWPDVEEGTTREMDIVMSRGFFERLRLRDPTRPLERCVFSTMVHELGHVLGLEHPRDRALPSSMQAVGASRCDKSQPTEADRVNLLRRYGSVDDQ